MDTMELYNHRKSSTVVQLKDINNNVLSNTKVKVKLSNHKFLFGCGGFDTLGMVSTPKGSEINELFTKRVEKWLEVYNYATLPFYWGNFEKEEGNPDTENLMKAALFLKSHNVTLKGHPLCWHTVCAPWLLKYDNETILQKQLNRIDREVSDFKGIIDMWDVINEVVIMPVFDKYDNAVTRICNYLGPVNLVKKVFDQAVKNNPDGTFLINDFNTTQAYADLLSSLLDVGVPIKTIGIQSHQHQGYWGLEKLNTVLDRFSKFNLPIHFTENTLVSGTLIPPEIEDLNDWQVKEWPSTPEGEERQLKQTEEMYRTLFAHPLVEAITGWDFADGAWLNAPSGVVYKDATPKPVYYMLKDLIHKEWSTEYETVSDEKGNITLKGYKGDYIIEGDNCKMQIKLD